ncbi:MAG: zinc ribbon domain-containing protein [Thomasclavelia sp.]|nr:zinc ribbon domain-containing protein [Thomasclavelia sp.]
MNCPKCGNHLEDDAKYCDKCGYRLVSEKQAYLDRDNGSYNVNINDDVNNMNRYSSHAQFKEGPNDHSTRNTNIGIIMVVLAVVLIFILFNL